MYAELWNQLGANYRQNCLAWSHGERPVIPPTGMGWQAVWTANPDFLQLGDRLLLFYRGNGYLPHRESAHDRIGMAEILRFDHQGIHLAEAHPVVDVGEADEFDGIDVLDPATVIFQNQVFLYYSAIGPGPDSIGLAVDGKKHGFVMVGRAPDVVVYEDRLRMIYQRPDANGNYQVFVAESRDGYTFEDLRPEPAFQPTKGSWDGLSIATVRLASEGDYYYALYGGSAYLADEPDYFGLARTRDLLEWEFHPGNPIFGCGAKGSPDGGAMWFPALHESETHFLLLYEGSPGKYTFDLESAICMASLPKI